MEKGRLAIKQRAAALEAAEAARRFQQETLGEQAEQAGGPNVTRFVEQLSGRVRSQHPLDMPLTQGAQSPSSSCISHTVLVLLHRGLHVCSRVAHMTQGACRVDKVKGQHLCHLLV